MTNKEKAFNNERTKNVSKYLRMMLVIITMMTVAGWKKKVTPPEVTVPVTTEAQTTTAVETTEAKETTKPEERTQAVAEEEKYVANTVEELIEILEKEGKLSELNVLVLDEAAKSGKLIKEGQKVSLALTEKFFVYSAEGVTNIVCSTKEKLVDKRNWIGDNLVELLFIDFEGEADITLKIPDKFSIKLTIEENYSSSTLIDSNETVEVITGINSYEEWSVTEEFYSLINPDNGTLFLMNKEAGTAKVIKGGETVKYEEEETLIFYTLAGTYLYKDSSPKGIISYNTKGIGMDWILDVDTSKITEETTVTIIVSAGYGEEKKLLVTFIP